MTKRALLIGINYFDTNSELRGCHNDVENMKNILINKFNYPPENIVLMKDDKKEGITKRYMLTIKKQPKNTPTKKNILREMNRLISLTKSGDVLFIHYSGHGSYKLDQNNDEADNRDEQICTVDDKYIIDDDLYNILVKNLPYGAKLRGIFDCCHSGTILDTRYRFRYGDKVYIENKNSSNEKDIVIISGCLDYQTSADAFILNSYTGALTYCFLDILKNIDINSLTWKTLITLLKEKIYDNHFTQIPQLSYDRLGLHKAIIDL